MSEINLNCTDCDELFLDYFEGDLDARRRAQVDAHVSQCARCQGIVRDFEMIQREARALPDIAPSRDLWSGIEARIASPVVSIAQHRERAPISRRVMGLAAAALVIVSSSVTYLATRGTVTDKGTRQIAEGPRETPDLSATNEVPSAGSSAPEPTVAGSQSEAPKPAPAAPTPSVKRSTVTLRSPSTSLASNKTAAPTASELALAPEIASLQMTLRQRRSQLDPETVKVVEDNLKVIDLAVEQAKAALRKDPASGFLNEQLDGALQKKVELLRTVALLPSRT